MTFKLGACACAIASLAISCSSSGGGNTGTDASGSGTGTDGSTVPESITIAGTTSSVGITGETPESGVDVAIFEGSDNTMVGSATSNGSGAFTLSATTHGAAVDGYLEASMGSAYLTTYLYPPKPLIADVTGATVLLLSQNILDTAATLGSTSQTSGDGFIGIDVLDASGSAVAGATITATVDGNAAGTLVYDGSNSLPSSSATETGSDGTAYVFSVTPGVVTVSATKSGTTFSSHTVKAYAGAVTETVVEP